MSNDASRSRRVPPTQDLGEHEAVRLPHDTPGEGSDDPASNLRYGAGVAITMLSEHEQARRRLSSRHAGRSLAARSLAKGTKWTAVQRRRILS